MRYGGRSVREAQNMIDEEKLEKIRIVRRQRNALHKIGVRCIRKAYFGTEHTATMVESALADFIEEADLRTVKKFSWIKKIQDQEPLDEPNGGYSATHTSALYDVACTAFNGADCVSPEIHMMIMRISMQGAASNYAWIAFQADTMAWVGTSHRVISNLRYHPQALTGIDPFSECGP